MTHPRTVSAARKESSRSWPQALADGAAGIALLHIERAHCGRGGWDAAHRWLAAASSDTLSAAANASLYFGAPAVAFAVNAASAPGASGRYQATMRRLDEAVLALTRSRAAAAHARIDRGDAPLMREFDLVSGLAGLGAYHLRRHPDHPITLEILHYLTRLTEPLPGRDDLPPWWTPVAPTGDPSPDYPHGHGNLGVSHGIGSVLALLSLAVLEDLPVPGSRDAIHRLCTWTDTWLQNASTAPWWPGYVTVDQAPARHPGAHPRQRIPLPGSLRPRPSWCYGIGGTARAQQLAALALADTTRQRTAETAMLSTLRDPVQVDRLTETGLCHGLAGLLQTAWRMAAQARTPELAAEIPLLAARLIARPHDPLADPSLLDGAAGIALALHTVGTGISPATGWDAVLTLA
ncbi:lanthionine synthetase C family protein [Actinomadura sp. LOL_016]|uniref:lanthionine synthetase C family protein n=1 Tax=Actinomadura sp. LOL_016 TaxID=3345411 RepID=UPI003A8A8846